MGEAEDAGALTHLRRKRGWFTGVVPGGPRAHGSSLAPYHRMTDLHLTQEMIEDGMARVEKAACTPGDGCCSVFPDPLEEARQTCTPKVRCLIGWIVSNGGRDSWDVWLDVKTGARRLRRRKP
jgi:hypothetical protein